MCKRAAGESRSLQQMSTDPVFVQLPADRITMYLFFIRKKKHAADSAAQHLVVACGADVSKRVVLGGKPAIEPPVLGIVNARDATETTLRDLKTVFRLPQSSPEHVVIKNPALAPPNKKPRVKHGIGGRKDETESAKAVHIRWIGQIPIDLLMICVTQGRQISGVHYLHGLSIMLSVEPYDLHDLVHFPWVWICTAQILHSVS